MRTKVCNLILIMIALSIFWFSLPAAIAQTEEPTVGNRFGVGARAMGMGGAFIGVADDFAAIHYNPAGLAQIKKFELSGGLSHTALDTDISFFGSPELSVRRSATRPNSFGVVWPVNTYQGGLAFAFGVNRVQSFDSKAAIKGLDKSGDPIFGGLFVDETQSNSGSIYAWDLGGAVYISPHIALGASLGVWTGKSSYELNSIATDTEDVDKKLREFNFYDTVDRDFWGLSGKAGLLAHLGKYVRVGLTASLPISLDVDEDWTQETTTVFDDGKEDYKEDEGYFPYEIKLPFEFGGGIAVNLSYLTLAADLQYADWTQTRYSVPPAKDVSNEDFEKFYSDTLEARIGGELNIPKIDTQLRAGFLRAPLPFTAKKIDTDRYFLTFGIGTLIDGTLKLDIAYLRGLWEQSSVDKKEKRTSNQVFFSAAYRY